MLSCIWLVSYLLLEIANISTQLYVGPCDNLCCGLLTDISCVYASEQLV